MARKPIKKPRPSVGRSAWRWFKIGLTGLLTLLLALTAVVMVVFLPAFRRAEKLVSTVDARLSPVELPPSKIFTADGQLIYSIVREYRVPFKLKDVPVKVRNAFLAAEDKRFYQHGGIDAMGLVRALTLAVRDGGASQGGSTLTMQLAKRLYNGSEKSYTRKINDVAVAYELEKIRTKDEILELYLRQAYFGSGAHGLGAAAKVYFDRPISALSVGQAAMLSRCVRRPSSDSPFRNPERALNNRDVVLGIMRDEGMIDAKTYDVYSKQSLKEMGLSKDSRGHRAGAGGKTYPFVVDHVLKQIEEEYGSDVDLALGGYKIVTTVNGPLQGLAEQEVRRVVRKHRRDKVGNAAFVVADENGRILAEVGGADYDKTQYNVISDGQRQPGSAFKPIVYATGLATGRLSEGMYFSNAPVAYTGTGAGDTWTPQNSGNASAAGYDMATALALSVNRPAVVALDKTGIKTVVQYGKDAFGIRSKLQPFLSLALGATAISPLELAEAYSVFMLGGDRVRPMIISRIEGPDGFVKNYTSQIFRNVLDPRAATSMDRLLRNVVMSGTGRPAQVVPEARAKTGTTTSHRDVWFVGYAQGLVGVAWAGNSDNSPMGARTWGSVVTVDFWNPIMRQALKIKRERRAHDNAAPATAGVAFVERPSETTVTRSERRRLRRERQEREAEERRQETPPAEPERQEPTPRTPTPAPERVEPFPETVPPIEDAPPPQPRERTEPEPDRRDEERRRQRDEARREARDDARQRARDEARRRDRARPTVTEVSVEVCVDSGGRAGMYCPETVTRKFPRGRAPGPCRLKHGA